jgi:transmembrane sensor
MKKDRMQPGAKGLLQKYLDGTATSQEIQQVLRWYYSFDKKDDPSIDESELQNILQSSKHQILAATQRPKKRLNYQWLQIAALLAICVTAALLGTYNHQPAETPFYQVNTGSGQRKTVTLSDGTRIWLNNTSKLKYPAKFAGNTREIELDGEAFFKVAHNPKHPFLIHTRTVKVQVLGTSFNVRSYAADQDIAVNVATGKVAVISDVKTVMLEKNEGIVYNRNTHGFNTSAEDAAMSHAWQNGVLIFRYQTLENICISLERWYGIKCDIKSEKLKKKKYTLEQHHETLNNVMKALSAGEFKYKITGKTVELWQ